MKATGQANKPPETCTDPCGMLDLINDIRTKHFIKRDIKRCLKCVCGVCGLLPVQKMCRYQWTAAGVGAGVVLDVQSEILQRERVKVRCDDLRTTRLEDLANREADKPRPSTELEHAHRRRRRLGCTAAQPEPRRLLRDHLRQHARALPRLRTD